MINKVQKKSFTADGMKRLTHTMELLLMECHERELLNQDPCDIATHFAKGLLKRKLLKARTFINSTGKGIMGLYITNAGKKYLEDL